MLGLARPGTGAIVRQWVLHLNSFLARLKALCNYVHVMIAQHAQGPDSLTLECTPRSHRNMQSHSTTHNVLNYNLKAKEKLGKARFEEIISAVLMLGPKKPALMAALIDRACSDDTARKIAQRYSVHESTLSLWIRRIGLRAHPRGRRALKEPTSDHKRILELVRAHGGAEAARRSGISKQWVSRVVHKWEPQLGNRRGAKIATVPTVRRLRRNFVVSFRMTKVEWDQLKAAEVQGERTELSGPSKARQIILKHITPPGADGSPKSSLGIASGNPVTKIANVHSQSVAHSPHPGTYQV